MSFFFVPAGVPAQPLLELQRQIDRVLREPPPPKAKHRICEVRRECRDCGRSDLQIALDEYRPCFEVI